jgi:hypothetical protein
MAILGDGMHLPLEFRTQLTESVVSNQRNCLAAISEATHLRSRRFYLKTFQYSNNTGGYNMMVKNNNTDLVIITYSFLQNSRGVLFLKPTIQARI